LTKIKTMPVLFVGHGGPVNLVLDDAYTRSLQKLTTELARSEAVCIISAHWQAAGRGQTARSKPLQEFSRRSSCRSRCGRMFVLVEELS
jgi:4,5-DOPA dioxygenase extradiol